MLSIIMLNVESFNFMLGVAILSVVILSVFILSFITLAPWWLKLTQFNILSYLIIPILYQLASNRYKLVVSIINHFNLVL
jgi:hypothetical protein